MSDPSSTKSPFSFGAPATSGGSSNSLFGQPNSNAGNLSGGLFGSGASNTPNSTGGIFGSSNNPSMTSGSGLFGSTTTTTGAAQPASFGSAPSATEKSSLFGSNTSSGSNPFGGGSNATTGEGFSGFSTPNKPTDASAAGLNQTGGLFGGASTGGSAMFGTLGSNAATTAAAGSITPAPSKPGPAFSFSTVSTTPAGPPPSGATGGGTASGSGFSFSKPQEKQPNLFGGGQSSASQTPATAAAANPFASTPTSTAGGLFGTNKSSDTAATSTAPSSTGLFGSTTSTSGSGLFGSNNPTTQQPTSLFGGKTQNADDAGQGTQGSNLQPSGLFNNPNLTKSSFPSKLQPTGPFTMSGALQSPLSSSQLPAPTNPSATGGLPSFSVSGAQQSHSQSTLSPVSTAPSTGKGFTSFTPSSLQSSGPQDKGIEVTGGSRPTASSSTAPSATPSAPSKSTGLFGGAPVTSSALSSSTSLFGGATTASSAPSQSTGLFGGTKTTTEASKEPKNTTESAAPSANDTTNATTNLGASTSGPRPPPQSRLKNKSMDEIITRWSSDLSKYQKEFQKQAQKVADWDRLLVENSDKIQKLYGSTLEAERATVEVERQLTLVENDQSELEHWLDYYERQVDEMMATQVGQGDALQGPDQERERTYKLAERLSDRLDEMGKDLTSMIEEINDASSNLSRSTKSDDPLSQIVRVLNSHLSQLQQIDQGAAALQAKVTATQRASRGIGSAQSQNGFGNDAADDFYWSYMGRR